MRRSVFLAIVVMLGLPTGFLVRSELEANPDRATQAIELFKTNCIPFGRQQKTPPMSGLVRVASVGKSESWADPQSQLLLELDRRSCTISDALTHMNAVERASWAEQASEMVTDSFPMLRKEEIPMAARWDLFLSWFEFGRQDPRRWGVTLIRWAESGEEATTLLRLSFAPDE